MKFFLNQISSQYFSPWNLFREIEKYQNNADTLAVEKEFRCLKDTKV